jgi:hypothetical protein
MIASGQQQGHAGSLSIQGFEQSRQRLRRMRGLCHFNRPERADVDGNRLSVDFAGRRGGRGSGIGCKSMPA